MSMTAVQPITAAPATALEAGDAPFPSDPPRRGGFTWEVVKTAIAAAVFAALLLPVAFPSKANSQGRLQQVSAEEAPSAAKPLAQKADAQKAVRKPAKNI